MEELYFAWSRVAGLAAWSYGKNFVLLEQSGWPAAWSYVFDGKHVTIRSGCKLEINDF